MKAATTRLKTILGHLNNVDFSDKVLSKLRSDRLFAVIEQRNMNLNLNECSASFPVEDRKFQHTINGCNLTQAQRQFYDDNGFIVIKKLVSDDVLNSCRDHFVDICNGVCPPNGIFLMKEPTLLKAGATGEHLYYKIQDLLHDDVFSLYTTLPKLLDYVQCFTGPNITAIHSMLINKPPDAENTTIHPLHQDLLYFPFRPADKIVGTWTAMEAVDTENGCLVVLPGSHKKGQLHSHSKQEFQTGPYKTFFGVKDMQNEKPIPLCMEKGDTVFLHPLLIHGSGPNRSKRFRKAISCHYAASDCKIIDIENTVHTNIARDIEGTAAKQIGVPIDFATIMKVRSVVVRGSEGFTAE